MCDDLPALPPLECMKTAGLLACRVTAACKMNCCVYLVCMYVVKGLSLNSQHGGISGGSCGPRHAEQCGAAVLVLLCWVFQHSRSVLLSLDETCYAGTRSRQAPLIWKYI